jgi:hypothetical protein
MSLGRRLALGALTIAIVAAPLAVAAPAGAKATFGHGRVVCSISGDLKFGPPLTATFRKTKMGMRGTLTCSHGVTGVAGSTVVGGTVIGTAKKYGGSCLSRPPGALKLRIRWKTTGANVAPTKIAFDEGGHVSPNVFRYPISTKIKGSYAAERAETRFVMPAACGAGNGTATASFAATLEINWPCAPPIPTEVGPSQHQNGEIYWLIASTCMNNRSIQPTGTITWSQTPGPGNSPSCSGRSAAVVNAGPGQVWGVNRLRGLHNAPYGVRGIASGWNLVTDNCSFAHSFRMRYSGDARFEAWDSDSAYR